MSDRSRLTLALWEDGLRVVLLTPVWWYTTGLLLALRRVRYRLQEGDQLTGFSVWAGNLFIPMYGQYDVAGRLISIGVRLVQSLVRGAAFIVWSAVVLALFVGYVTAPILVVVQLIRVWPLL